MPSTAIQSRISAFESLSKPGTTSKPSSSLSPTSSPPRTLPKRPSASPHDILEMPFSPSTPAPLSHPNPSPSPSPPNLGRRTSLIDLKDWVVDDGHSPSHTANGSATHLDSTRTPTQQLFNNARIQPSTSTAPLINLDSPPKPKPKPKPPALSATVKAPPLPPRKPSYTSLKSAASSSSSKSSPGPTSAFLYPPNRSNSLTVDHTYPPLKLDHDLRSRNSSGHAPASSISSFHSVSLSSDTDPSTPGSVSNFIATFPMDRESLHDRDSSFTSRNSEVDSISLTESYEDVSTSSLASPSTERMISMDWEKAMSRRKPVPPQLPKRPPSTAPVSSRSSMKSPPPRPPSINTQSMPASPRIHPSQSNSALATSYQVRRVPPPPPSRASDRSSIQSTATTHSTTSNSTQSHQSRLTSPVHLKTKRPTPVPAAARRRYECVFNANVVQQRRAEKEKRDKEEKPALLSPTEARGRRAAGWRGLSVDLITSGDAPPPYPPNGVEEERHVGSNERLEGGVVKLIWSRSGLDRARLSEIWSECDPTNRGSIDLDAFVKGMWRIDEELRRANLQAIKSASTVSLGSFRSKNVRAGFKPPPPVPKPRNILR
ncbi:hypothetical protein BDQ12DRAFT_719357 [Crucibulum laeve]|uniref:EH domain-containing protein n=1 Tax=Crucibulum laeve TaxID=68775 RepID=A0A5C3MAJ0_9AGAR|nr:hypothetical protein BDQ12DRAFT_719357 [Crucibulum laeve]